MVVVFSVYIWKDLLDGLDRVLMANTQLDMTFLVYTVDRGDSVMWVQEGLRSEFLDVFMTHFYVMGFMTAHSSFVYPIYFDDRHMADRVSLSMFWVYILAIPFYLFLNVKVTGELCWGDGDNCIRLNS